MADVDSHRIIRTDSFFIPNLLINLIDGKYLPGILHQKKKDIVLNGSQLNRLPVHKDLLVVIVDQKAAALVHILRGVLGQVAKLGIAADVGLDPCHQLQRVKGLGNIVVSPDIKSQDLVIVLGLGG